MIWLATAANLRASNPIQVDVVVERVPPEDRPATVAFPADSWR
jgi:hypothetical protein